MKVILQKDDQYGEDGPKKGAEMYLVEIRKIDGEFWAYAACNTGQDKYDLYLVLLDDLLVWNTESTQSYGTTRT